MRPQNCRPQASHRVPWATLLYVARRPCVLKRCAPRAALVLSTRWHMVQAQTCSTGRALLLAPHARRQSAHRANVVVCSARKAAKSSRSRLAIRPFIHPVRDVKRWCHSAHPAWPSTGHPACPLTSHSRSRRACCSQVASCCSTAHRARGPALHIDWRRLRRACLAKLARGAVPVRRCTAGAAHL